MTFRDASLLWILVFTPLLIGALVLASILRKRASQRFGSEIALQRLLIDTPKKVRAIRGFLVIFAWVLLVITFAGPQYGSHTRILRRRGVDVVIALDFSKSMLARDVRPSRLERAKSEIRRLLDDLGGDRVGMVAFAGETMEFPMTVDYSSISLFLRDLGPYDMPVGGTAIGRALMASERLLERSHANQNRTAENNQSSQVVLLITDGEDHEGDPISAAEELKQRGMIVHVLGVGSRRGEPIPTYSPDGTWTGYQRNEQGSVITTALTPENERQLQRIARITGGKYFKAQEGSLSLAPFRREISKLKSTERRTRQVTISEDRFMYVLIPVFILLAIEGLWPDILRQFWKRREVAS